MILKPYISLNFSSFPKFKYRPCVYCTGHIKKLKEQGASPAFLAHKKRKFSTYYQLEKLPMLYWSLHANEIFWGDIYV